MMHQTVEPAAAKVSIYAHHYMRAIDKLLKLQRRAARYGQSITWTERPFTEQRKVTLWGGETKVVDIPRIELAVTGSAPKVGDFVFLAQLERAPGGVLVSAVPGAEIGDLGFQWDGRCDHCGSNRQRKVAFVVEGPDGRKVVGKSCLRDHMGTDAPEGLLWQFAQFADLTSDRDEDDDGWGLGSYRWEEMTLGVIATARAAIALWGWRPSSHEGDTTAGHTMLLFERPRTDSKGRDPWAKERRQLRDELAARSDHYYAAAEAILEWGRVQLANARSDYERNLHVALNADVVVGKTFNLVVSACAAWDRQVAREDEQRKAREAEAAKRASMPKSEHVGQPGDRITHTVTLERAVGLPDNGFGPSTIYVLRADDGPVLSWKTGGTARLPSTVADRLGKPLEVGDRVVITATVKAHAEFRGEKETRVLRAKFAPVPAE